MTSTPTTGPAPRGSRAFSKRAESTAFSDFRVVTSSRSGIMPRSSGIRIVDVRHEVAAVHMAHAHAELTRQSRRRHGHSGSRSDQHRDGGRKRVAGTRPGSADRRLHLARPGQYRTAARHPACRHPAAGDAAVAHPSGPRPGRSASSTKASAGRSATSASPDRFTSRFRPTCCAPMSRPTSSSMSGCSRRNRG